MVHAFFVKGQAAFNPFLLFLPHLLKDGFEYVRRGGETDDGDGREEGTLHPLKAFDNSGLGGRGEDDVIGAGFAVDGYVFLQEGEHVRHILRIACDGDGRCVDGIIRGSKRDDMSDMR